jgi:hypothetical protein
LPAADNPPASQDNENTAAAGKWLNQVAFDDGPLPEREVINIV